MQSRTRPTFSYQAGQFTRIVLPYALRVAVLLLVIVRLAPAPPRLVVDGAQTVQTAHPVVCVHTRLTDEVEDWKIQRTLQLVREMGASSIVEFFPWSYIEGSPGNYDWHHPDRIIDLAHEQGLTVIARLGLVPRWAQPQEADQRASQNSLDPAHYADFARFVGAFAQRYRGKVDRIIPWNEPNLSFEWGYRSVSPADYVDLLKQVYTEAHRGNPDVQLLAGALAPTLDSSGTNAWTDLDYLRGMYAAGAKDYFDGLAVHTYGFTVSPDEPPAPDKLNFRRAELLHQIMVDNGDSSKPIYITESGWNDHPRWTNAVRPGERISYTLEGYQLAEREWPWAKTVCTWYFRAPYPTRSYPDYFAFVTPEFRLRPIYSAVKDYTQR